MEKEWQNINIENIDVYQPAPCINLPRSPL